MEIYLEYFFNFLKGTTDGVQACVKCNKFALKFYNGRLMVTLHIQYYICCTKTYCALLLHSDNRYNVMAQSHNSQNRQSFQD